MGGAQAEVGVETDRPDSSSEMDWARCWGGCGLRSLREKQRDLQVAAEWTGRDGGHLGLRGCRGTEEK